MKKVQAYYICVTVFVISGVCTPTFNVAVFSHVQIINYLQLVNIAKETKLQCSTKSA